MSTTRNGDSGLPLTDLPPLPKGWCWARVGELGEVRLGRQRSPKNRSEQHPTKYIRAANITWKGLDLSDVLDMEFKPTELEAYRLLPGDVLLSEASGSPGEVGKPAIWRGEIEDCCFQNTVIRFRPKEMPPEFPFVVFCHFARNGIFSNAGKGVGIHHLSADRFSTLPMPLAPLNEQHRIVAKIEELFSDLDAGVAALERIRANLKRYRAAVLKAAVEGRLTEEWRAKNSTTEPATKLLERILAERRKKWEEDQLAKFAAADKTPPKGWREKYVEPAGPDMSGLPELPQGWCWATAEQLCSQINDGEHNQPRYQEVGLPMLTATHVRDGFLSFPDARLIAPDDFERARKRCGPMEGDILIVCVGATTGRAAIVDTKTKFALVRSVLLLKPLSSARYLLNWIRSPWCQRWIQRASGASAQAHFYISDAKRMAVPLPPQNEQSQIVMEIAERLSQIERASELVEVSQLRASRIRQSILKRAFEGKLVPQDPTDEPADKLLERIRQERTASNGSEAQRAERRRSSRKQAEGGTQGAES